MSKAIKSYFIFLNIVLISLIKSNLALGSLLGFEDNCTQYNAPISEFISKRGNLVGVSHSFILKQNLTELEIEEWLWFKEASRLQLPLLRQFQFRLSSLNNEIKKFKPDFSTPSSELREMFDVSNLIGIIQEKINKNNVKIVSSVKIRRLSYTQKEKLTLDNLELSKTRQALMATLPLLANAKIQKLIRKIKSNHLLSFEKFSIRESHFLWNLSLLIERKLKVLQKQVRFYQNVANENEDLVAKDLLFKSSEFSNLFMDWGNYYQLLLSKQTDPIDVLGASDLISAKCRLQTRLYEHKAKLLIADTLFDMATLIPLIGAGRIFTLGIQKYGFLGAIFSRNFLPVMLVDIGIFNYDKTRIDSINRECQNLEVQAAAFIDQKSGLNIRTLNAELERSQQAVNMCYKERRHYLLKAIIAAAGGMSINAHYSAKSIMRLHLIN